MPEQDELFKAGQKQGRQQDAAAKNGDTTEAAPVTEAATEEVEPKSSATDKSNDAAESADIAGGGIADGQVRAVNLPAKPAASNRLLLLLLLAVLLLSGWLFFVNHGFIGGQVATDVSVVESTAEPPIRLPIERPVEEVVMEPKQVAAAEQTESPKQQGGMPLPKEAPATNATERKRLAAILYSVLVGPYLNSTQLDTAAAELKQLGFATEETKGRGMVSMTRLLEGVYPVEQAHQRLKEIQKTVKSAFLLPADGKLALYVGSFADPQRASHFKEQLIERGLRVEPVVNDIEMSGKMLLIVQADRDTAAQLAAKLAKSGFKTQVVRQ